MSVDGFIQTFSGRFVQPLALSSDDVALEDIAHALGNQCRFGGHCRSFYSVGQHSCLVADLVAAEDAGAESALWALLHDASEAYLVDIPHPLKHSPFGELYRDVETRLMETICRRFGLPPEAPALVKRIDRAVLATERRELMRDGHEWPELAGVEPLPLSIEPWLPPRAVGEFTRRYEELEARR